MMIALYLLSIYLFICLAIDLLFIYLLIQYPSIFFSIYLSIQLYVSVFNITLLYSGYTAFILAAKNGHLNIIEFLLNKGSSVKENNRWGKIKFYLCVFISSVYEKNEFGMI